MTRDDFSALRRKGIELRAGGEKLGVLVSQQIKRHIVELKWPVGHSLGTERELMHHLGVSRATLREAVRQLEAQGLVEARCGVHGGLVICAPARKVVVRTLATHLELIGVTFDEMIETRALLEGLASRLASRRIGLPGAENLRSLQRERKALKELRLTHCLEFGIRIRELIAELSGNPAVLMLIETMDSFSLDLMSVAPAPKPLQKKQIDYQTRAQDRLIEAVIGRKPQRAQEISRESLLAGAKVFASTLSEATSDTRRWSSKRGERNAPDSTLKLSQQIAIEIARDIAALTAGQRLGLEPEIQARYGVSRAVCREALRILEFHGLTRTQRGKSGGIIASHPDSRHTVDSASLYLRFVRFDTAALFDVFRELALGAIELTSRRAGEAGLTALHEILQRQLRFSYGAPGWVAAITDFHMVLGELSGNRMLALFLRVLIVTSRDIGMFAFPPESKPAYDRSHMKVLRALSKGDPVFARRALQKHFEVALRFS